MPKLIEVTLIDVSQDQRDEIGEVEFHHLPRVGEHVVLPSADGQMVYEVTHVLHTGGPLGNGNDIFVQKIAPVATFFAASRMR